ncbi:putative membrane protein [Rhizobium sp. OAE497]
MAVHIGMWFEPSLESRFWWRLVLSAIYLTVGILHMLLPGPFLRIMPALVPFPAAVVFITGACEVAAAAGLLSSPFRAAAGIGLATYAVCVYPANIKHAIDGLSAVDASTYAWLYHVPRLAFQPVFVWWALYSGGVIDWPFPQAR